MLSSKARALIMSAFAYNTARNPFGLKQIKAQICASDVVLDAGCGTGQHLSRLASHARELHGIDVDPSRVEIANSISAENVHVTVGSITDLKFENYKFDVVLVCQVLHHLCADNVLDPEPLKKAVQQAMYEVARVLKPQGKLILVTTSSTQRREGYWHFRFFPQSAWNRLQHVWTLTELPWFDDTMTDIGFKLTQSVTPDESHWVGDCNVSVVEKGLSEEWRSTDVAFELLTDSEMKDFIEEVEQVFNQGKAEEVVSNTINGRKEFGEATLRTYQCAK